MLPLSAISSITLVSVVLSQLRVTMAELQKVFFLAKVLWYHNPRFCLLSPQLLCSDFLLWDYCEIFSSLCITKYTSPEHDGGPSTGCSVHLLWNDPAPSPAWAAVNTLSHLPAPPLGHLVASDCLSPSQPPSCWAVREDINSSPFLHSPVWTHTVTHPPHSLMRPKTWLDPA